MSQRRFLPRHRRAGRRQHQHHDRRSAGPALLQDIWLLEKLAHFDREVIPERRMHAKGWGAHGPSPSRRHHPISPRLRSSQRSASRRQCSPAFDGCRRTRRRGCGARHTRTALKFYTEDGNWDIVGNNTPVFFFRDPLRFSDLNHAIKRDPRTGLRSADNNGIFGHCCPRRCTR